MTRPIRILELRSVRGTGGGPEKTILLGAARSDPREFAVTVCYIRDLRDDVFSIDQRADGLPVDYVEIRERNSTDHRIWPALRRLVREREIDIVHAHDYKTDFLTWLLGRQGDAIALSTAHGWTGNSTRERFYYRADKWLLARFPRVIAVSEEIRQMLIASGSSPARVTTVLNGIDHVKFHRDRTQEREARTALGLPADALVLGAVGRLEQQKRFDLLIEAVGRLSQRYPTLRLVIAGDGSLRGELQAQIDRMGLGEICHLLGLQTDIGRFHHALNLLVQSSEYEGTPNIVLEAMAFETPLVATNAGGTAELAQDGVHGLIIPHGSVDALVDAITRALNDPASAAHRVALARRRVEGPLSFTERMAQVEEIYRQLMREASTIKAGRASRSPSSSTPA